MPTLRKLKFEIRTATKQSHTNNPDEGTAAQGNYIDKI